jgi:hypothetical protein
VFLPAGRQCHIEIAPVDDLVHRLCRTQQGKRQCVDGEGWWGGVRGSKAIVFCGQFVQLLVGGILR